MRLIPKLYMSFGFLLTITLLSAAVAMWSARHAAFHLERTNLAHRVYENYLSLSSHTYQLFKQFGDAMLIGDRDRGAGETELLGKIRQDIATIRNLTAKEIELVGEEEIEELGRLSAIERHLELLLLEYTNLLSSPGEFGAEWGRLSRMLDETIDRDFKALVQEALDDEAGEVRETAEETAMKIRLFEMLAVICGLVAFIAAFVSLAWLIRDIRRPIGKLLVGARAFAEGDLGYRIKTSGPSELEDVVRAFNGMANEIATREAALSQSKAKLEKAVVDRTSELQRAMAQLKTNEDNRKRLLADVSHELRTPLTIIQGEADIALRGGIKPPELYREALEKSRDAARHTARLVDDLLFVARRESGETRLNLKDVDLAVLLPEIIEESRSLDNGRGTAISFVSDASQAVIRGDGDRIRQVVIILLENALRYGEGKVQVRLHGAPAGYAISVTDDGPGMSEEEQDRAFERFFRGSNAAERYQEGAGLGLPVAKAIVEAHGGDIGITSEPGEGATVSFTLPTRPRLQAVS